MKYFTVLFLALFLFSCTKEDVCQECTVYVESNLKEAQKKCDGNGNNYPELSFFATGSEMRCGDEIAESLAAAGTEEFVLCKIDGVDIVVTTVTTMTCVKK